MKIYACVCLPISYVSIYIYMFYVYGSTSVLPVLYKFLLWVWYSKKKNCNSPFSMRNHAFTDAKVPADANPMLRWETFTFRALAHAVVVSPGLVAKQVQKGLQVFFVVNGLFVISSSVIIIAIVEFCIFDLMILIPCHGLSWAASRSCHWN